MMEFTVKKNGKKGRESMREFSVPDIERFPRYIAQFKKKKNYKAEQCQRKVNKYMHFYLHIFA